MRELADEEWDEEWDDGKLWDRNGKLDEISLFLFWWWDGWLRDGKMVVDEELLLLLWDGWDNFAKKERKN